jgi:hypothetical protein
MFIRRGILRVATVPGDGTGAPSLSLVLAWRSATVARRRCRASVEEVLLWTAHGSINARSVRKTLNAGALAAVGLPPATGGVDADTTGNSATPNSQSDVHLAARPAQCSLNGVACESRMG